MQNNYSTYRLVVSEMILAVNGVCSNATGKGFCDREPEKTLHGCYIWNETRVGQTDAQICVYGPKEEYKPDGRATRVCMGPLRWEMYSGIECVSEATNRLRSLAEVR